MEAQQAGENSSKPRDVDRGGAGDVDNNTSVHPPTHNDTTLANMNAETEGLLYARNVANSSLLDPAQSAHLCLLAAKSPKSNIYKTYDKTRRSRSFIPHWVVEYPWLEFNPEKECMFCVYCREYQRTHDPEFTNTFVHGATNFRLDSVKAHDNSTKHRQVMLVMSGKIASVPKPASKQATKSPRAGAGGKGMDDRLRVGAFFDSEVDGYDDPQLLGASSSSIHRTPEDDGNPRHIPASADLTDEPFYPPNPMAKYIKTLQNIYPHLPLNEMASSETRLATATPQQPSQLSTTPSSRVDDAPQQAMIQEENGQDPLVKEEPVSPSLAEQGQHEERERDVREATSTSMGGGGGMIGRSVPPMRKVWQVNTNEASSMSQEEEDEDVEIAGECDQTGNAAAVPNERDDHPDQEYEGEAAEGILQRSGAMTDFFINPVVPVYRQGKRTTRLLPKAKRQKLEMIMARQMQGEDVMNVSDDSIGDQHFQSEPEVDVPNSSPYHDPHWKQLAESFAAKYNQLCEEHTSLMKLFQSKVTSLEKKCNELEQACQTRQGAPLNNSSHQDGIPRGQGAVGGSQSSPRINMYSSVVVLQMQGHDPVNIRSNADANFNAVQQNLSQSGIHISLGANNIPNTIEQQLSLHSGARDQRLHSTPSPSVSSRKTGEVSGSAVTPDAGEEISSYNVSSERAEISSRVGNAVPKLVSGVGSTLQKDLEMQKSNLSGCENQTTDKHEKHGYLMGNETVSDCADLCGNDASAPISKTGDPVHGSDVVDGNASHCNDPATTLDESVLDAAGAQEAVSCKKVTACSSASSTANGIV